MKQEVELRSLILGTYKTDSGNEGDPYLDDTEIIREIDNNGRTSKYILNENVLLTTRCGEYKDDSGKINQQYV